MNDSLRKKWDAAPGRSSVSKWADIDAIAKTGASKALDGRALLEAKQDIVLEYTYPRLDVEVSKKQIHLLKSPFVIHPGTGRVCVPIDTKRLTEFDPLGVPTVTELLGEIDAFDGQAKKEESHVKKPQDYEKTSLRPYVDYFKIYVAGLLREEKGAKRGREEDAMEFWDSVSFLPKLCQSFACDWEPSMDHWQSPKMPWSGRRPWVSKGIGDCVLLSIYL